MVKYRQDKLSNVLQALADPTRRQILERLSKGNPTVLELARPFKMSLPAVSKHLRVLESAGLIKRRKEGRFNYFEVMKKPILDVNTWIQVYSEFWSNNFARLDKYLKSKGRK